MIKQLILLLLYIVSSTVQATSRLDPFNPPYTMTCQSISAQLQQQIAQWLFYGVVEQYRTDSIATAYNQQIWLKHHDSRWQVLLSGTEDKLFLSWQVQTFTHNQLIWQAELPKYCSDTITFLMSQEGE